MNQVAKNSHLNVIFLDLTSELCKISISYWFFLYIKNFVFYYFTFIHDETFYNIFQWIFYCCFTPYLNGSLFLCRWYCYLNKTALSYDMRILWKVIQRIVSTGNGGKYMLCDKISNFFKKNTYSDNTNTADTTLNTSQLEVSVG